MRINLKDFRQSHNLSQAEMTEILQLNQSNVSRAELRGYYELSYLQKQTLEERFGAEEVKRFEVPDNEERGRVTANVSGNSNNGEVTMNNGFFAADIKAMEIIKQQSETIARLAEKQGELTEHVIVLLEIISKKM